MSSFVFIKPNNDLVFFSDTINVIVYQYLRQCFDNKIRIGLSVSNQAIYYAKHFHLICMLYALSLEHFFYNL